MRSVQYESNIITETVEGEPVRLMNGVCCCPQCEASDWLLKHAYVHRVVVEEDHSITRLRNSEQYRVVCKRCGLSTAPEFFKKVAICNAVILCRKEML